MWAPLFVALLALVETPSIARAEPLDSDSVALKVDVVPIAEIKFPDDFDFFIHVPEKKGHPVLPAILPFKIRGNALATVTAIPDDFLRVKNGPWLGEARRISSGGHHHYWDWKGWKSWHWDDWGDGHGDDDHDRNKNNRRQGRSGDGKAGSDQDANDRGRGNSDALRRGRGYDDDDDHGGSGSGATKLGYNAIVRFPVVTWAHLLPPNWTGFATGIYGNGLSSLPGQNNAGTLPLTANVAGHEHGRLGLIFIVSKRNWTENGKDAQPGKYRGTLEVTVTADGD
jgi:hypothetical protein